MTIVPKPIRKLAEGRVVAALEKVLLSESGRRIILNAARPLAKSSPRILDLPLVEQPYEELASALISPATQRDDVVFITARFRSGSTLLWNLLRHVEGVTAYYEPFNERRWFDPKTRGSRVDQTHRQVEDYWREYDGLEELGRWYDREWTHRDLYMDEYAWAPRMKRYVELLIERAVGRPVLQFNRIDLRLPWFRRQFPKAKIIHLYRHPRDQWCSTLSADAQCGPAAGLADFAHCDAYYLLPWARDLATHFPFLRPEEVRHPYELFYLIWRLSYLFGRRFGDYSIGFERLVENPERELATLFDCLHVTGWNPDRLMALLSPPAIGKWRVYADEPWFREVEESCEQKLAEYFA